MTPTRETGLEKIGAWIREELEKKTIFRRADDRRSGCGVDSREKGEGMRDQALLSRPQLEVLISFIMFMTVTPPPPPNNSTLAGIMGALLKGIKKSRRRVENRIKELAAPSLVQLMQTSISSHMRATTALSLFLDSPGLSRNPSRNPWEASTGSVPRERSAGASKSVLGLSPSRFCLVMQHSSPNQSKNYGELSVHKTQNIQLLDLMLGQ